MDFLKSAVASISKTPAFGYTFGDRVDVDQSIWTLHNGTKREDGSKCSIFSFDINANRSRLPLARNALRKFKTLRHPGVIKMLDTVETDQLIYIATERVTPLSWSTRRKALSEESLKWGLHTVARTVKFINDEASSIHGSIRVASIFTTEAGEWKVGGLEILSSVKEDDAVIFTQSSLVPDIGRYTAPEIIKGGWNSVKQHPTHVIDSYDYGILITEVFNGGFSGSEQVGTVKNIPPSMQTSYKRLTHAVPKMRLSVGHFLEQGTRSGGFFDTPLIQLTNGIENMGLKSETERDVFLRELETVADSDDFPEDFFKVKVLPELLKSVEFGGGGPKSFALVMRIATKLSDEEYDSQITPAVIRLFSSPDRALRVCLLDNLPHMIEHLSQKIVTDKIFPQMVTGFGDMAPVVREQTVKAVLVVAPKLSDRVINGELLRYLAKTANDEQAGIRTNTTICLGKIAKHLGVNTRAKVLTAAFARSLRDPFVHARNAALMALAATVDIFSEDDCATKMLPAICPSLVDKEKMIREQANKTLNIYLERVRRYGNSLPDTVLPPPDSQSSQPSTRISTPQPSNQWMGWAISSFTNKLGPASGEIQPNSNGVRPTPLERSTSERSASNVTAAGNAGMPGRPAHTHSTHSTPAVPRTSSALRTVDQVSAVEDEDFGDGWGEMDEEDDSKNAWDDAFGNERPQSRTDTRPSTASVQYDDGGEPDFEGWLNAQAKSKSSSKPLPKGLAKKSQPPKPAGASAPTTAQPKPGPSGSRKPAPPAAKAANSKGQEPAPATEGGEDDDWDAWG
ncbi:ARM repeat-containing protein [Polychaeton citri CBS 116435]|uniref:ARM repeat-containing protein n=1 Tax=Polychaeton citri CBS 116435 TaxID=1314669 RepID=A0A9P4UQ29_9PEZI|nr:ARM repeat-containing protein [Polychaeton citri CBS 116435]